MIRRNEYVSVHETRAQVTREKLLKAAIKLVNRDGMKQLTVRNICDEAGVLQRYGSRICFGFICFKP